MVEQRVRIWVGAFGKHPGWDDHIADQGLETELLTKVKRLLYLEGIGGNVDHGTWDAMDAADRIGAFNHVFLWRWPKGLVAGRMWSSSDGKGRTRYPLIICAHTAGLAAAWVAQEVVAQLDEVCALCRETRDAQAVISAIDQARRALRQRSKAAPAAMAAASGTPALTEIARALGEQGLQRVCYQLERDFASFFRPEPESGARSRTPDARPRQMRVPRLSDPSAACEFWLRFMLERVSLHTPVLAIAPVDGRHVDLLVGEPTRTQFACIAASTANIPLATEIPYTIDQAFALRVQSRVQAAREGQLADVDPGWIGASFAPHSGPRSPRSRMIVVAVAIVGVLIVALVLALIFWTGSGLSARPTASGQALFHREWQPAADRRGKNDLGSLAGDRGV